MSKMLDQMTERFQRKALDELIKQLTDKQRDFLYNKVFPKGIKKNHIATAYALCERTIAKNIERENTPAPMCNWSTLENKNDTE